MLGNLQAPPPALPCRHAPANGGAGEAGRLCFARGAGCALAGGRAVRGPEKGCCSRAGTMFGVHGARPRRAAHRRSLAVVSGRLGVLSQVRKQVTGGAEWRSAGMEAQGAPWRYSRSMQRPSPSFCGAKWRQLGVGATWCVFPCQCQAVPTFGTSWHQLAGANKHHDWRQVVPACARG